MPKISVILNTHNGRKEYCKKAIQSVLNQSYEDFELVIVDDASKDGTDKMVSEFNDERIKYIHRNKNWGNDTRPKNDGIKASVGDYIALLDSDNTYRVDHLAILLNAIQSDPSLDLVYGDRWIVDDIAKQDRGLGVSAEFSVAELIAHNYIDTSDVLIKRQALFDVGGFDERYKKYVDWNLWLRMAKFGHNMKHVAKIITDYHLHEDMKSLTVKDKQPNGDVAVPMGTVKPFNPEWNAYDLEVALPFLGDVKEPTVSVYTLTYDRLPETKKAFDSLYTLAGYDFNHVIVDNGSTDGTKEWLKDLKPYGFCKEIRIINNVDNKGISISSNQAVEVIRKEFKSDCILKYDNDAISMNSDWLKAMVKIYKSNHLLALSCYIGGLRDNPGGAARIGYGNLCGEMIGMTKHVGGICHFVGSKAYEDWKWPENEQLHGMQDVEFSQFLLRKGYQMGYLENYTVMHSLGTEGQHNAYPEYFERRKLEKQTRYEKN